VSEGKESWTLIFVEKSAYLRFLLAIFFLFVMLVLFIECLLFLLKPERLSYNGKEGTVEISGIGQPARGITILPASALWLNTGIRVRDGQTLEIKSSGRVNLAIHRLVEGAREGGPLHHGWVGPGGEAPASPIFESRVKLLIDPSAKIGTVLGYVKPDTGDEPGVNNARPTGLVPLGSQGVITGKGTLWLTVNDYILSPATDMRNAYAGTEKIIEDSHYTIEEERKSGDGATYYVPKKPTVDELKRRWDGFVDAGNYSMFFQDNVGDFLVEVTVRD
jgi:hypothetical protein